MTESGAKTNRREMLRRLSQAIAAAALAPAAVPAGNSFAASGIKKPVPALPVTGVVRDHFFTAEEEDALAAVADCIIPADDVSGGAREAGVQDWIDFLVANSPGEVQGRWRGGLEALDQLSEESAGARFLSLDRERQRRLLENLALNEEQPATKAERFFVLAKEATVNGYYTSEIGLIRDLGYKGGTYVSEPETACPAHVEGEPAPAHPAEPRKSAPRGGPK